MLYKCYGALRDGKNYGPVAEPISQSDIGWGVGGVVARGCRGKQPSSDKHQSSPAGEMMRPRK